MNMAAKHPKAPAKENPQWTLNSGRQAGLPIRLPKPAERLRSPYVVKKNIDKTGAIKFKLPARIPAKANRNEMIIAIWGSWFFPKPRPTNRKTIPSFAMACRVRGAPNKDPTALESVAP